MLGFLGSVSVQKDSQWGAGKDIIWLDDVRCKGIESSLTECGHSPWGVTNCGHDEDVGVTCSNNPEYIANVSNN